MIGALLLGLAMIGLCLMLQALAAIVSVRLNRRSRAPGVVAAFRRLSLMLAILTVGVFAQMAAWALLWRLLGQFESFEQALYFSGVTFTSLGYGDVVAKGPVRLLAPVEAASGLIMFAVLTAVFINGLEREARQRPR